MSRCPVVVAVLALAGVTPAWAQPAGPPPEEEVGPIPHDDDPDEEEDPIPDVSSHDDVPTEELPEGEDEAQLQGAWDPTARPEPVIDHHEVAASFDLMVANRANAGATRIDYYWTPEGIDRHDLAVPQVRRFVLARSWLRAGILRDGNTIESRTGALAEGVWRPLGILVAAARIGIELDTTRYDPGEEGYWATPMQASLGWRPLDRLELAAVAGYRPIIAAETKDNVNPVRVAKRDGHDREVGGRVTWASPGDRILVDLLVLHRRAKWEFEGFSPGRLGYEGLDSTLDLRVQTTATMSMGLYARMTQMHWNNQRTLDEDPDLVGEDLQRDVLGLEADVLYWYWFEGRLAFRASAGGGYQAEAPIFYRTVQNGGDRGFFRLGLGVQSRF